jgi:hypothetical protein
MVARIVNALWLIAVDPHRSGSISLRPSIEKIVRAVKKLARAGALPYSLVSDLRRVCTCTRRRKETYMLWTIFVILLVLWLLGLVSSYTLGGFIHLLLIIAVVVLVIQLIQGRTPPV